MPIGSNGIVEVFLPPGGTAGQALVKIDTVDYNATWGAGGVGGGVASLSAGTTQATGAQIVFSNSPTVSFGAAGNTITASAAVAGGAAMAISAGTQSNNTGTVVFSNSNNVTFGMSNSSIVTASFSQSVQTQASGAIAGSGFTSAGNNIGLSGTHNSAGLSLSATVAAQTNQTVASGGIAGSGFTSAGANVGLSGTLNSAGLSLSATAAAQSVQPVAVSGSNGSFAFSTLTMGNLNGLSFYTSNGSVVGSYTTPAGGGIAAAAGTQTGGTGTVVFSNSNNVTFGMSNSSVITASISVPAQTNQSLGIYASSQTTGQSSSSTVDARSVTYVGMGIMSVGMSGGSVIISGPDTTALAVPAAIQVSDNTYSTGTIIFKNANGISFGSSGANGISASFSGGGGGGIGAGVSTMGNTAGSTGTVTTGNVILVGSGALTLSQSTGAAGSAATITFSVPQTSSLVGAGGVSLSTNGSTISVSLQGLGIYASSQTTGQSSSSTYDARSLSIVGAGLVSVGLSGGSLIISGSAAGGQNPALSANNGSFTYATASFSNVNNVSFATAAGSAIQGSYALNVSATGGTSVGLSGLTFKDSQGVSFGLSTGAGVGTITASVAAQSNQSAGIYASSQTFGQSSSSTHDARSLTVVGSGGVSVGWSNSSLLISGTTYPAQSIQSAIKAFGASNTGNTAGNTGVSSGIDWVLAGSNNITISESTVGGGPNTLWISGPSVAGAQTGISGIIASDATYTSGTVSFSNQANITIGSSVNGATQYIRLSGNPAQTVQTQASGAIAGSGFTSAGNNIGLSGTNNSLGLSLSATVAAQTNQSLGIYASSQTFGQSSSSTHDARSLSLVGSGNVSVGWSNSSLLISGATQTVQTQASGAIAGSGVTTAGNNIGLSGTLNSAGLSLSATVAAQTNQSLGIYASSQTYGQSSSSTHDARSLSVVGSGGVSVGWSNSSLLISGQTTVAQSNQTLGIYGSSQTTGQSSSSTHDARSLSIVGAGGVSVGWSNSSLVISGGAGGGGGIGAGVSTMGNTAGSTGTVTTGNVIFVGSGALTLSQSTGAAGSAATITFSVPQTSSLAGAGGVSLSTNGSTISVSLQGLGVYASSQTYGQSSSSTYDARSLSVVGSGGVSVGWSNSSLLISGQTTVAQSNQTGGIYITAQSTGQSSSSTHDLRTLSMVGDGLISIGWSNGSLRVSGTQSNQAFSAAGGSSAFQTLGFSDNAAASWTNTNGSVALASVRASLYATSNTTQSSTGTANLNSLIFAGAGIASVGVTNGSIVVSVPSGGGAGDGGVFAGVSTAGNTAGSTGTVSTGNFVLVGSGALTLSQSTGAAGSAATVTFNVPQSSSIVGVNGVSISTNGSTISVSGIPLYTAMTYQNRQLGASTNSVPGQNSVWLVPMRIAVPVNAGTGLHMVSITGTVTSNQTNTVGLTWEAALYKVTGTNDSRFDTIFTTSMGFTFWNSGTVSVSYSYNVTSSSSAGSNLMTASVYGLRQLTFNIGSTLDTGMYAWGFRQSTSSAGQSSVLRSFNAVMDNPVPVAMGFVGSATNASIGYVDGGTYSATSGAMPASFEFSQIKQTLNAVPYIKVGTI